jgi:AraC family transcriptional regulator
MSTSPSPAPLLRPTSIRTSASGQAELQLPERWSGFPINLYRSAGVSECGPSHIEHPTLLLGLEGCQGRRWHRENGRVTELTAGTGGLDLYGRDYQRGWARWDVRPGTTLAVPLLPEVVQRFVPDACSLDLPTRHSVVDPKLRWLARELLDEARAGAPSGPMYAEALCCALIARLASHHGGAKQAPAAIGGLSAERRRRIVDYIEAHLGEELSIATLAQQVYLSPDHFARSFNLTFGQPPHRYVQQRRIESARRLLRSSSLPVVDIALELGFNSHTHFTRVFRQHTGLTPSAARLS